MGRRRTDRTRNTIDRFPTDVELRDSVIYGLRGEGGGGPDAVDYNLLLREPNFFDDLGAQEMLGGVTLQWIELTMKDIVLSRWDLWSLTIEELNQIDGESTYANFERLAQRVRGEKLGPYRRFKRWLLTTVSY